MAILQVLVCCGTHMRQPQEDAGLPSGVAVELVSGAGGPQAHGHVAGV